MMQTLTDLSAWNQGLSASSSAGLPQQQSICAGCRQPIFDRFVLRVAPEFTFHEACLKCSTCQTPLGERGTAFVRDGKTYCRTDYERLTSCHGCRQPIGPCERVQGALNDRYHEACFKCAVCQRQLVRGDEFVARNDQLFCRDHLNFYANQHFSPTVSPMDEEMTTSEEESEVENVGAIQQSSVSPPSGSLFRHPLSLTTNHYPPQQFSTVRREARKRKSEEKTSRVRTSMSEQQLETLKRTYEENHKPDAIEKERLCRATGLTMKVVRVWFQNRRCKDKKMREAAFAYQ